MSLANSTSCKTWSLTVMFMDLNAVHLSRTLVRSFNCLDKSLRVFPTMQLFV